MFCHMPLVWRALRRRRRHHNYCHWYWYWYWYSCEWLLGHVASCCENVGGDCDDCYDEMGGCYQEASFVPTISSYIATVIEIFESIVIPRWTCYRILPYCRIWVNDEYATIFEYSAHPYCSGYTTGAVQILRKLVSSVLAATFNKDYSSTVLFF